MSNEFFVKPEKSKLIYADDGATITCNAKRGGNAYGILKIPSDTRYIHSWKFKVVKSVNGDIHFGIIKENKIPNNNDLRPFKQNGNGYALRNNGWKYSPNGDSKKQYKLSDEEKAFKGPATILMRLDHEEKDDKQLAFIINDDTVDPVYIDNIEVKSDFNYKMAIYLYNCCSVKLISYTKRTKKEEQEILDEKQDLFNQDMLRKLDNQSPKVENIQDFNDEKKLEYLERIKRFKLRQNNRQSLQNIANDVEQGFKEEEKQLEQQGKQRQANRQSQIDFGLGFIKDMERKWQEWNVDNIILWITLQNEDFSQYHDILELNLKQLIVKGKKQKNGKKGKDHVDIRCIDLKMLDSWGLKRNDAQFFMDAVHRLPNIKSL